MVGSGVNLATTKDGGTYNKLQRPQDYLIPQTAPPPPKYVSPADISRSPSTTKRKREQPDGTAKYKRTKSEPGVAHIDFGGMRTVLPGLDDEEGSSDDSTGDAIAYLRDVRSEASAIPHLLGGSTTTCSHDHPAESDLHVLFREGAWIAIEKRTTAFGSDKSSEEEASDVEPQDRVYQLLLKRFHCLRAMLAMDDEEKHASTTQITAKTNDIYLLKSERAWSDTIARELPHLNRIVHMDEATVYRGLKYCAGSFDQADTISPQHSCWIWSLLASVRDVGTLDNDKISRIRDLGRKAGLMGARLRNATGVGEYAESGSVARGHFPEDSHETLSRPTVAPGGRSREYPLPVDTDESDAAMSVSGDEDHTLRGTEASHMELARARLLTQLGDRLVTAEAPLPKTHQQTIYGIDDGRGRLEDADEDGPDLNTRVTIDMVLTIVVECFGQRDLLKYRQRW